MRHRGMSLLGALGPIRIATIVVSAIVVGVVAGYALATLTGNDGPAPTVAQTVPASAAAGPDGPQVVRAELFPATTASGRRRQRARVQLTVSVRNLSGAARPMSSRPTLIAGDARLHIDPAAATDAAGLLRPIPALSLVTGVLRFETVGSVTERLTQLRRARLRIAGQTLPLKLTISTQPAG